MQFEINMNGFPEYGIHLLAPTDETFAEMIAILEEANPDRKDEIEALIPYSLIIRYDGVPNIIAYAIKWDMVTIDGHAHPWTGTRTSNAMLGEIVPATGELPSHLRTIMRSGSFWFCSPLHQPEEIPIGNRNQKIDPGSGMGEGLIEGCFRKVQPGLVMSAMKAFERGDPSLLRSLRVKQLANYPTITFSMDGVLFDNGIVIGADTSGFFDRVKSIRDGRHDLLVRVANGIRDNEPLETIFREIADIIAEGPDMHSIDWSDAKTYYATYRKMCAEELVGRRSWLGDDKFYEYVLDELRRNWPEFRKR